MQSPETQAAGAPDIPEVGSNKDVKEKAACAPGQAEAHPADPCPLPPAPPRAAPSPRTPPAQPVGTSPASEVELEAWGVGGDSPPRPASAFQGLGQAPPQLRALSERNGGFA